MRISDWTSDVCSSDLCAACPRHDPVDFFHPQRDVGAQYADAYLLVRVVAGQRLQRVQRRRDALAALLDAAGQFAGVDAGGDRQRRRRSEEHTSELQSLMRISYAVFCLKKKTQ